MTNIKVSTTDSTTPGLNGLSGILVFTPCGVCSAVFETDMLRHAHKHLLSILPSFCEIKIHTTPWHALQLSVSALQIQREVINYASQPQIMNLVHNNFLFQY